MSVKRMILLLALFLLSFWMAIIYLKQLSSPILAATEWVSGIETANADLVQKWSLWDGRELEREEAEQLIETLNQHEDWKRIIYHTLLEQSESIYHHEPEQQIPWFHLTRLPYRFSYKVSIPSIYMVIENPLSDPFQLSIGNQIYTATDNRIGPILPIDQVMRLSYSTPWGEFEERRSIDFQYLWSENEVHLLPSSPVSAFYVKSNIEGGDLFIDSKYWGKQNSSALIAPLPYAEHQVQVVYTLPWGEIASKPVPVKPGQREVEVDISLQNYELMKQLGETLVQYNEGWVRAAKSGNPAFITKATPELKSLMGEMLAERTSGAHFDGDFIQLLLNPASIEIEDPSAGEYTVHVRVREDYADSKWAGKDGEIIEAYEPHRFWQYTLRHDPEYGWLVSDFAAINQEEASVEAWIPFHSEHILRLGVDAGLPPFEFIEKDQLRGFDIEFIQFLGERLGIKIILVELPWNQMSAQLQPDGGLDGIISAIESGDLGKIESIQTEPYLELGEKQYVILLRKDLLLIREKINLFLRELQQGNNEEYSQIKRKYFRD